MSGESVGLVPASLSLSSPAFPRLSFSFCFITSNFFSKSRMENICFCSQKTSAWIHHFSMSQQEFEVWTIPSWRLLLLVSGNIFLYVAFSLFTWTIRKLFFSLQNSLPFFSVSSTPISPDPLHLSRSAGCVRRMFLHLLGRECANILPGTLATNYDSGTACTLQSRQLSALTLAAGFRGWSFLECL